MVTSRTHIATQRTSAGRMRASCLPRVPVYCSLCILLESIYTYVCILSYPILSATPSFLEARRKSARHTKITKLLICAICQGFLADCVRSCRSVNSFNDHNPHLLGGKRRVSRAADSHLAGTAAAECRKCPMPSSDTRRDMPTQHTPDCQLQHYIHMRLGYSGSQPQGCLLNGDIILQQ